LGQKRRVIIDSHVHLYPPETGADPAGWAAVQREPHWALLCTRRRRDGRPVQGFPTVAELLRDMDAAGIGRAVLLGWYWERPETCAGQNRFYARCVRDHGDRLSAFATLHPAAGAEGIRNEIRRARDEGLIGLGELSPHSQGVAVDDPVFGEALALAGEAGLPVNLHVTDPAGRSHPGRVATPLADFVRLARRHPGTTFVLAHWGGLLSLAEGGPEGGLPPNVCFDTAASPLLYDAGVWARALPACGAGRVIFGSDYPLRLYPNLEDGPGWGRFVAEARAGGADGAVLGDNARRWLRLPPERRA
jgi:predicted TIM-barrel fold metal-dependent hydrolase